MRRGGSRSPCPSIWTSSPRASSHSLIGGFSGHVTRAFQSVLTPASPSTHLWESCSRQCRCSANHPCSPAASALTSASGRARRRGTTGSFTHWRGKPAWARWRRWSSLISSPDRNNRHCGPATATESLTTRIPMHCRTRRPLNCTDDWSHCSVLISMSPSDNLLYKIYKMGFKQQVFCLFIQIEFNIFNIYADI